MSTREPNGVSAESQFPSEDIPRRTIWVQLLARFNEPPSTRLVAPEEKAGQKPSVPISPNDPPSDTTLFEDPADPAKKYYLPRYRLAEEIVSGQARYRIALERKGAKWSFSIVFEKFPAPELGVSAREAKELSHKTQFVLVHRIFLEGSQSGLKERELSDVSPVEGGIRATLILETLEERDQLYRALTDAAYATNVIVRRSMHVALPLPLPNSGAHTLSSGTIVLQADQGFDLIAGSTNEKTPHIRWTSEKTIAPVSGVELGLLGKVDFKQVDFAQLRATAHGSAELPAAGTWDANSVVNAIAHWNPPGAAGIYDAHPLGVWYTGSSWSIFHQNMQAMVPNAAFVVTNSKPSSTVFVHKAHNALPQWRAWNSLGAPAGGFLNAPSSVSRNPQACSVYVRGGDQVLWQLPFDGKWLAWIKHDGILLTEPAANSMHPNHEQVFVQGADGQLFQKWWANDGGGWRGWFGLGAPTPGFIGRPAAVARNPKVCNVYVRGNDNALWQLAWSGGKWGGWGRHADGGVLASPPAAGSMNPNHEHVFVRGTDGQVWVKWWLQGSGWSAWAALGAPPGGFVGGPVITQSAATCDLFVRGVDNALWQRGYRSGGWASWERHNDGGVLAEDPSASSLKPDQLQLVVRGADGNVWQKSGGGQTIGNISGNTTSIDHPSLNGNANALCQVTQNWNPGGSGGIYNSKHIGIYFTGSRHAIFNQDRSPMVVGAAFNIRIAASDRSFVHRAAPDNISGHVTIMRHPELDGKPALMLLITSNWNPGGAGGVYNDHSFGVYYTGANWAIFNQDFAAMPVGAAFNVEMVQGPEGFIHQARPETNSGNFTVMDPRSSGAVTKNTVISIRLGEKSMAKLLVLDCTDLLSLQWETYTTATLYKEDAVRLDLARLRESFVFPPNLYPYIYRGIEDISDGKAGLVRRTVEWNGAQQPYYQDETQRRLFYFLPDAFKVARRAGPVRAPDMNVRVSSPDGSLEKTTGSLGYVAVPTTEAARLEAARKRLQVHVPDGGGDAVLELLPATKLSFKLGLPKPGSAGVSFTEQKDALLTMTKLRHSVELPVDALQAVFEGIFSSSSLIFQGQIEITLGERDSIPPVPFEARMDDLAGDPLECAVRGQPTRPEASLRNVIESPLRIRRIRITVRSGTRTVSAELEGLALPLDLAPAQQVAYPLRLEGSLEITDETEVHFDLREVEVIADREAIWNAILETRVQPEYIRKVGVRTVADLFRGPEPRISLIRVNLQRAGGPIVSVDLTEEQLQTEASLSAPLRDYVLGRVDPGEFQYQVFAVRGGMRTPTSLWKNASANLIITTEDLP